MEPFAAAIDLYAKELTNFIIEHNLSRVWFEKPDHIAFKAKDTPDFEQALQRFKPHLEQLTYVEMQARRLASGKLKVPVTIGQFGKVQWLEIMEPRLERIGKDAVGLEHVEFLLPDLISAEGVLKDRQVIYERQQNPAHSWLNIPLNDQGQEIKLTSGSLEDIVMHQLTGGEATVVSE